jgi:hypothetical protein
MPHIPALFNPLPRHFTELYHWAGRYTLGSTSEHLLTVTREQAVKGMLCGLSQGMGGHNRAKILRTCQAAIEDLLQQLKEAPGSHDVGGVVTSKLKGLLAECAVHLPACTAVGGGRRGGLGGASGLAGAGTPSSIAAGVFVCVVAMLVVHAMHLRVHYAAHYGMCPSLLTYIVK